jgi:hypothetical protein
MDSWTDKYGFRACRYSITVWKGELSNGSTGKERPASTFESLQLTGSNERNQRMVAAKQSHGTIYLGDLLLFLFDVLELPKRLGRLRIDVVADILTRFDTLNLAGFVSHVAVFLIQSGAASIDAST